jgi:hypothetical protein
MQADEFQELKDSINIHGVFNPITLHDDMVLDGWHRYRITTEYGMDCPMTVLADDVDPRDFVLAQNKARRNLSASQKAMAVTSVYQWYPSRRPSNSAPAEKLTIGGKENKGAAAAPLFKTNVELAEIAGTSVRSIQFAKAVDANAVPELKAAVKSGTVSVETAAKVAKLPAAEQKAIAASGPDAMRAVASKNTETAGNVTTEKQNEADQIAQDAYGDEDLGTLLEKSNAENNELRTLLDLSEADHKVAELLKYKRIADVAVGRQYELMDTVNQRENELRLLNNWQRRICKAVSENNPINAMAAVEAKFRAQQVTAGRSHEVADQ